MLTLGGSHTGQVLCFVGRAGFGGWGLGAFLAGMLFAFKGEVVR